MITAQQVIDEARKWLKTPFAHMGRRKGCSVDCLGLFVGVNAALHMIDYDDTPYGREPDPKKMLAGLRHYLVPVALADMRPADIIHINMAVEPSHLAIYTERNTIIHAMMHYGVREHRLDDSWRAKIRGVYRIPGVSNG